MPVPSAAALRSAGHGGSPSLTRHVSRERDQPAGDPREGDPESFLVEYLLDRLDGVGQGSSAGADRAR